MDYHSHQQWRAANTVYGANASHSGNSNHSYSAQTTHTPVSFPAPAPVYTDIINDDLWITNGPAPTATAIAHDDSMYASSSDGDEVIHFTSDRFGSSYTSAGHESDKVVVLPPSSVLFDERAYSNTAVPSSSNYNDQYNDPNRSPYHSNPPAPVSPTGSPRFGTALLSPPTPTATFVGTTASLAQQQEPERQRTFKGKMVQPKHAHLPDAVLEFREKRIQRTMIATWTGGAVGLVTAGPIGAVAGGVGAYAAAKTVGKHRERKLLEQCTDPTAEHPTHNGSHGPVRHQSSNYDAAAMAGTPTDFSGRAVPFTSIPIHRAEAA